MPIGGFLLFVMLALSRGSVHKPTSVSLAVGVAAGDVLDFRQLPCFSGSCDNWMFANVVHNTTRRQWDDTHCNEMAQKFGCHPCKSAAASATYSGFGTVIDPRRGAGRVTLCPSGSLAPGQRETARGGLTYEAIGLLPYAESLRMSRLPCWSGSCDHFLLEMDGLGYLQDDLVCHFWANRSFGCSHCKSEEAVRLHALSTHVVMGTHRFL